MRKCIGLLALAVASLIICRCGKNPPVETKAPASITLDDDFFEVPPEGQVITLTVTAPSIPKITGLPDWITLKDGLFKDYKTTYSLTVAENPGFDVREVILTITAGTHFKNLTVRQGAKEHPAWDAALTNPKASKAARSVYAFLKEQSGQKMLSGIQSGGTAYNNERIEAVYSMTGKHPAIAGYDFLFLHYSPTPSSWSWKVDYGDISAAKEHWLKNGLVSFMWHWNVPDSEEDWEKGKKGDFSGYNFYCDKTAFSIDRALQPGTWENEFILMDINKVAGYLKLLQEEGIPVLWRPLHEAAGNYMLYGSNGAWFWWGRGGAESCKQLWKLLRNKLEEEHGLDNLIWVWTLDATKGAENDYSAWYPGNDLVDIVGVDIYADDTEAKARQWEAAVSLSDGKKPVAISECGNIPDPDKCLTAKQTWSWFLAWDLDGYALNTETYWKRLMSSDLVLVRENMPALK